MRLDFGIAYGRKPELTDLEDIYSYRNDQEVIQTLVGFSVGMSREEVRRWIEHYSAKHDNDYVWMITEKGTDRCMGHCGLYRIDFQSGKSEFGVVLAKWAWKKGLGGRITANVLDYAFKELRLNRVEVYSFAANEKMGRINKRLGVTEEGTLREAIYRNGVYHDLKLSAILCRDWSGVPKFYSNEQAGP